MNKRLPAARRSHLLQYVTDHKHASVPALAEHFGVSHDTVRRDIESLAKLGLVSRTHGGVVVTDNLAGRTHPLTWRASEMQEAKRLIGQRTADAITDGETLFLGGGSTVLEVVRALRDQRHLTIVTNSLVVPSEIPDDVADDVWVVGGKVREVALSTYGALELPGTSRLHADRAVVGVSGISAGGGFSVAAPADAAIVREMLTQSRTPVVVADSSKFGRDAFAAAASFDEVEILVTDEVPSTELATALAASGVSVIRAVENHIANE